jgi:hypothetical protein
VSSSNTHAYKRKIFKDSPKYGSFDFKRYYNPRYPKTSKDGFRQVMGLLLGRSYDQDAAQSPPSFPGGLGFTTSQLFREHARHHLVTRRGEPDMPL